jgi:hypothetical protein
MTAMRLFVLNLTDPTLFPYVCSIDHSPSEQVDGSEWHTSALIISQNMEHHALADELGKRINPTSKSLKQWKDSSENYRRQFHQEFFHVLKDYPVLALTVTSKEKTILAYEQFLANELGIAGCYKRVELDGKKKVEFGPFTYEENTPPKILIVSARHAPMAIFTANHLLRIHTFLKKAIGERIGIAEVPVWIQVWSDKPPNDFVGNYAELMWLLLGGGNAQGKFTWGGFTENTNQAIDLLADNLAGLFNEIIQRPDQNRYKGRELQPPVKGVFYWERLE